MKLVKILRVIYIAVVFFGPFFSISEVWTIANIFNGFMAIPNMIAIFALSGVVVRETVSFFRRYP